MTYYDDVQTVMRRLPVLEARDEPLIRAEAEQLLRRQWTVNDVVTYLHLLEEVSPDLDEETALRRMSLIEARYAGRKR
jgi:hypothetical protein